MGAHGVVGVAEPVELALRVGQGGWRGLLGQPLLLGLVEALDLSAGLRVVGPGVVEPDAEQVELDFQGDPAAATRLAGEDRAVVGEHAGRDAVAGERGPEPSRDVGTGGGRSGLGQQGQPGVVVDDVEDLHAAAVGQLPVRGVRLPAFVGLLRGEPVPAVLGRFLGCGVTNPRRVSTRQIVEVDGRRSVPDRWRWVRMVSAPASQPRLDRSLRSRMIWSSRSALIARGFVSGRREHGVNAPSPSAS